MLQNDIDGRIYNAIKALYSHPTAKIRLNEAYTDWFDTTSGVKQGYSLSPTLLGIYNNDLLSGVNQHILSLQIGNMIISILLFAGDIVLIAESEEKSMNGAENGNLL